ncbi:hypothetical protein R1flu_024701 [Riccia fluitans]|uniref:Uncharacterized protein n=1 Tax=Riccia fluitans TaxID=41844 RepID=A0ABD1XVN4_9MARC
MDYNPKLGRVPTARRRALAPVNATAKVCTGDEGIVRRRELMDYNPKLGRVPTARRRALAPVNATAKVCTGDEGIVRRRVRFTAEHSLNKELAAG